VLEAVRAVDLGVVGHHRPRSAQAELGQVRHGALSELGKTHGARRPVLLSRRALAALNAIPPRIDAPLV
jgi:hypothetical protein